MDNLINPDGKMWSKKDTQELKSDLELISKEMGLQYALELLTYGYKNTVMPRSAFGEIFVYLNKIEQNV